MAADEEGVAAEDVNRSFIPAALAALADVIWPEPEDATPEDYEAAVTGDWTGTRYGATA
jgi:hypothetical protein